MNMKFLKRVLAVTLAASLMVAPVITAGATTNSSEPAATSSTSTASQESTPATNPDVKTVGSFSVPGANLTSDVPGSYLIKTIAGIAVRQSAATIKAAAGLAANESVFVRAYDITAAKAPAAFASANFAATALGGTIKGALNIDLGKLTAGKNFTTLNGVAVPCTFGLRNVTAGKRLVVIRVLPGGAVEVLEDQDENPNTVTVNISGFGAYFIVEI
ncbi:MAG: hypothetical protein IKO76_02250 [Butyrivibrio sp.]|nr:hypothetical protein [Butyrivibrio sp.]